MIQKCGVDGMLTSALGLDGNKKMISLVGAGGKTSFIYALARELSSSQNKVIVTTTTHLIKPTGKVRELMVLESCPEKAIDKLKQIFINSNFAIWVAKASHDKVSGILPMNLDMLANEDIADYIIVEADGSKGLPIKAPASYEPVIPQKTNVLVGVIGIDALGCPINDKNVHRPSILRTIIQDPSVDIINEQVIWDLVYSPQGLFKNSKGCMEKVLVLNKIDNNQRLDVAYKLVKTIKDNVNVGISRILLTSFNYTRPMVRVILF